MLQSMKLAKGLTWAQRAGTIVDHLDKVEVAAEGIHGGGRTDRT
jgi:hypothetical protein